MVSNLITVKPILVEGHDLTMYYRNGSSYTIKTLDEQGRPVAGGPVKFNINGVYYTAYTDSNGVASLLIGLWPGEYIITVEYKGFMTSNLIRING